MTAQVTAAPFDTQTSLNLRAIACSKRFKEDYSGWDPAAENLSAFCGRNSVQGAHQDMLRKLCWLFCGDTTSKPSQM